MDLIHSDVDAFGLALLDYFETGDESITKIIRLEDGNEEDMPSSDYFNEFDAWEPCDRALTHWIVGRTLDIGVGAGRIALYLQEKGHDVVGIDISPGVVKVCKSRGVKDVRWHNIHDGPLEDEKFDTITLFGMNLGIAGLHKNVGPFLGTLKEMLRPDGRIVLTQINWQRTEKPEHIAFQEANRKAGKHPVEMTLRLKYKDLEEDFSWCLTNQDELVKIAAPLGLVPEVIIDCNQTYGCVLIYPADQE